MTSENKILRPSLIKTILLLLACSLFVFFGFYTLDQDPLVSWGCITFFGLGMIIFLIQLSPKSSSLKLTTEGFEVVNLFKSETIKWTEVIDFRSENIGLNKMVMFDYTDAHQKSNTGKKISKLLSGKEGALPNTYGMKAEKLAQLMNDWKSKNTDHTTIN